MSEEKSSSIGTIIVVAIAAGLIGYVIGKPAAPQVQAENPDPPEKPAELEEPKEPAFVKEGLVAYYPFNGNAKDESGNGNDGASTKVEFVGSGLGSDGKAAKFNGAGCRVAIDSKSFPVGNSPITLTFFVNVTGPPDSSEEFHIGYGGPPDTFFGFFGDGFAAEPKEEIVYRFTNMQTHMGVGTIRAKRNHWHMLTATYDGKTVTTYLDGARAESKPYTLQIAGTTITAVDTFYIGQRGTDSYRKTIGMVDQVRIYNRALSAEEVKALYDLEKPKE
jgi:hypothetical protein